MPLPLDVFPPERAYYLKNMKGVTMQKRKGFFCCSFYLFHLPFSSEVSPVTEVRLSKSFLSFMTLSALKKKVQKSDEVDTCLADEHSPDKMVFSQRIDHFFPKNSLNFDVVRDVISRARSKKKRIEDTERNVLDEMKALSST